MGGTNKNNVNEVTEAVCIALEIPKVTAADLQSFVEHTGALRALQRDLIPNLVQLIDLLAQIAMLVVESIKLLHQFGIVVRQLTLPFGGKEQGKEIRRGAEQFQQIGQAFFMLLPQTNG